MKKFYITTPIYYVNDRPHIGHTYTTLMADVLARWHRLKGEKVFFSTGTDEHGAKIEEAAKKAGQPPKEFCDEKAETFKTAWQVLNLSYDGFIRTTDVNHEAAVSQALQTLYDQSFIYKDIYKGLYCVGCEQYKSEDDLIDGLCSDHKTKPVLMKEESYFFRLAKFEKILQEKIVSDEFAIKPAEKKNEVLAFLSQGLKDISISRLNVSWGIPLPFDKKHTIYVWVDAFLNYLTGLDWNGKKIPPDPPLKKGGAWGGFWPPDLQLMSKDILRVHATIWPGLLLAFNFPLPQKLFVHGFFTIDGQKMSKSLGNIIWPEELVQKFGVDGARYLLISSLAFGQDGDVSWEKLIEKYNADLANGLGNLISRVIKLNENLKVRAEKSPQKLQNLDKLFDEAKLKEALDAIWMQIAWANKYIEDQKLWELIKNDKEKGKKVLSEILSLLVEISAAIAPFMPQTAERIQQTLASGKIEEVLFPRILT